MCHILCVLLWKANSVLKLKCSFLISIFSSLLLRMLNMLARGMSIKTCFFLRFLVCRFLMKYYQYKLYMQNELLPMFESERSLHDGTEYIPDFFIWNISFTNSYLMHCVSYGLRFCNYLYIMKQTSNVTRAMLSTFEQLLSFCY